MFVGPSLSLSEFRPQRSAWDPSQPLDGSSPQLWMDAAPAYLNGGAAINDGDAVSAWISREGDSRNFTQATGAKQPLYRASGINGQPGVDFDGTDDLLYLASSFLSGTAGTVVLVTRPQGAMGVNMRHLGTWQDVPASPYFNVFGIRIDNTFLISQRNNDTTDTVTAGTAAADTNYCILYGSDGTAYKMRVNGVQQGSITVVAGANNGDWFDDSTNRQNTVIGAQKFGATENSFVNGIISEILVYPVDLSAGALATLSAYINAKYGVAA